MCDPVSIITSVVGAAASMAMAPKAPKSNLTKPPQAAQQPDEAGRRATSAAASGVGPAPSSTMLTGTKGVTDALSLGRSTLLGQ